mmetsp:Transcript_91555/g.112129  ORF Transcript_91555/g.112129 Transcript_91555/m.112129 type:complete len:182 (+) Transcript_91555:25-570(+)
MENVDSARLWMQTKILSKLSLYNYTKDTFPGAHERDIIRIVNKWIKKHNYEPNWEEKSFYKHQNLVTMGYTTIGLLMPTGLLVSKSLREMCIGTRFKTFLFLSIMGICGYSNYVVSKSNYMENLLDMDNSVITYATFQVMCQPEYKRFRNKWQSQYNLSKVAYRYKNFDLYTSMQNQLLII